MYVSQIKVGESYAHILDYGHKSNWSCASTTDAASCVRVIERVAVPKITQDQCGRKSTINQTRFKVQMVNISPTHMFAGDIDAAVADGVHENETLVVAKDCLCLWEEEVERARSLAHRTLIAQRFRDYCAALAYMVASYNVERDETSRCSGDVNISINLTMGTLDHFVEMSDIVFKEHATSHYNREYGIPSVHIRAHTTVYPKDSTVGVRRNDNEFGWELSVDRGILFELELSMGIQIPPPPPQLTKTGSIHRSWAAWDRKRQEALDKLLDRYAELDWEARVELAELFIHRYAMTVANLLGGYYADRIETTSFSSSEPQSAFRSRQHKRFMMIADHLKADLCDSIKEDKI
ncbi:hypothetical protein DRO27_03685 [Candidatus Bathyarchaeota archaeon]|nr:MAG: hypothetical protein DRO27_03685 [Candidatus Bathyarchaeota archaeon]